MNKNKQSFSTLLDKYITLANYSPGELAKRSGVPKQTIVRWSTQDGVKKPRNWIYILKIATVLNLTKTEVVKLLNLAKHPIMAELVGYNNDKLLGYIDNDDDKKVILPWLKSINFDNELSIKIQQALLKNDFSVHIKDLEQEYPIEDIVIYLTSIIYDKRQNVWIRINALQTTLIFGSFNLNQWTELLQQQITELLSEIINILTKSNVILTKEQLYVLFANPALPHKSSGLGKMIVQFIGRGANYTSKVFLPLATYPSWEIKYDCVRTIIAIDDINSIKTLQSFTTMSYWQARRRTIKYISNRFNENSLSPQELKIAEQILTQIITDGKTDVDSPTMRQAKETLEIIQSNIA